MPTLISLDPRITRANIAPYDEAPITPKGALDQFQTYEVFSRQKSGGHHVHVGSVHAPSAELALAFAKEQYGRRGSTINLWVVATHDIVALGQEDSDIFETAGEKDYREVTAYVKVRDKIESFKQRTQA